MKVFSRPVVLEILHSLPSVFAVECFRLRLVLGGSEREQSRQTQSHEKMKGCPNFCTCEAAETE
eukprot:2901338-Rhodomonas_salina.1